MMWDVKASLLHTCNPEDSQRIRSRLSSHMSYPTVSLTVLAADVIANIGDPLGLFEFEVERGWSETHLKGT